MASYLRSIIEFAGSKLPWPAADTATEVVPTMEICESSNQYSNSSWASTLDPKKCFFDATSLEGVSEEGASVVELLSEASKANEAAAVVEQLAQTALAAGVNETDAEQVTMMVNHTAQALFNATGVINDTVGVLNVTDAFVHSTEVVNATVGLDVAVNGTDLANATFSVLNLTENVSTDSASSIIINATGIVSRLSDNLVSFGKLVAPEVGVTAVSTVGAYTCGRKALKKFEMREYNKEFFILTAAAGGCALVGACSITNFALKVITGQGIL